MRKQRKNQSVAEEMLSVAPMAAASATLNHRSIVPSPLSSSPIRPSSPHFPASDSTATRRYVRSSPIRSPPFRFSARPTRPVPLTRRPDEARESRRRNFLRSVRERADDNAWQRRDIEGQVMTKLLTSIVAASRLCVLSRLTREMAVFEIKLARRHRKIVPRCTTFHRG